MFSPIFESVKCKKSIFLQSEADAWYQRNHQAVARRNFAIDDPIAAAILKIGCSEGNRLSWLAEDLPVDVFGIESSAKVVEQASGRGINAKRGAADQLSFEGSTFDVVIFGFFVPIRSPRFVSNCAGGGQGAEARCLVGDQGFFALTPIRSEYHHKPGIFSYKMDYRTLFDWHPADTCYSHRLNHHGNSAYTDASQEWVAMSIMRKMTQVDE